MQLTDFIHDEMSLSLLGLFNLKDDKEMLNVLESYKFVDSYTLVSICNRVIDCPAVILGDDTEETRTQMYHLDELTPDKSLTDIMSKHNVLLVKSGDGLNVVASVFNDIDFTSLCLNVNEKIVSVQWVTPYNFELLKDRNYKYPYVPELLLKRLVLECVQMHSTDLHITVRHINKNPQYVVYYRQDGFLYPMRIFDFTKEMNHEVISKMIDKLTGRQSTDLDISAGVVASVSDVFGDGTTELRVSANKVRAGFECVCRIQNIKTVSLTIDKLGFPSYVQASMMKMSKKRTGLTLFTGPIRTGKNTSAFALANELVKQPIKIKSFESPIEALMPFPQVDYADEPQALADAVRLAKKQDLNVAFINEIPTKEVAFGVQDLVNSSVYVITTLHIDRIWHLPYKLYEYFGDSYRNIISQINGVYNQKMFPLLCPHCLTDIFVEDLEDPEVQGFLTAYDINKVAASTGCEHCIDSSTGTYGILRGKNQPFVEYLEFNDDLKSKLLRTSHVYEMEQILKEEIMATKRSLEYEILNAIQDKKIGVDAIYSII